MLEVASGVLVSPFLLAAIGMAIGLLSGFAGVGGGYMLTPTLVVLGFPSNVAVGTGIALVAGNALIAVARHRQLGHVDVKMGLNVMAGTLLGTEVGVRILHSLTELGQTVVDAAVLSVLLVVLMGIGLFMHHELVQARRRLQAMSPQEREACEDVQASQICQFFQRLAIPPRIGFSKSHVRISAWVVLLVGLCAGTLSGFLGVGGGFVRAPALMYLIGQPSVMAVGTDLLDIAVSGSFGCFRHAMMGNVNLTVALIMLLGTAVGTQLGAWGTVYLKGLAVRYVLEYSVITATIGPALKLLWFLTGRQSPWLNQASVVVTMLQVFVPVTVILALLSLAWRYQQGRSVPSWAQPLMVARHRPDP